MKKKSLLILIALALSVCLVAPAFAGRSPFPPLPKDLNPVEKLLIIPGALVPDAISELMTPTSGLNFVLDRTSSWAGVPVLNTLERLGGVVGLCKYPDIGERGYLASLPLLRNAVGGFTIGYTVANLNHGLSFSGHFWNKEFVPAAAYNVQNGLAFGGIAALASAADEGISGAFLK